MSDVSLCDIRSDETSRGLHEWLGGAYGLNKALEWRINDLFPRCTMLHSAQGGVPTANSNFPTPLSKSDPAPSGVFGSLAGSL
jgi:hypothetical protein